MVLITATALFFAVVFLTAATAKLDSWAAWCDTVRAWPLRPGWARVLTFVIPTVELVCVVSIVVSGRLGLEIAAAILVVFGLGAAAIARRDPDRAVSCGCFGAATPARVGYGLAARNLLLGALAGVVAALAGTSEYAHALVFLVTLIAWAAYAVVSESVAQERELRSVESRQVS